MHMINIYRKGIAHVPETAKCCPVCGQVQGNFTLERKLEASPMAEICQQVTEIIDYAQKYPTFVCEHCQTIWQYLGETPEKEEGEK